LFYRQFSIFLHIKKKEVAKFEKLYRSETIKANEDYCKKNNLSNTSIKGNLSLLKFEIDDIELHTKINQKEFAEIVFLYIDSENHKKIKTYFPMLLDFEQLNEDNLTKNNKKLSNVNEKKFSFKRIIKNSQAINNAICLYYSAKFMRKIMRISNSIPKKIKLNDHIKGSIDSIKKNSLGTSITVNPEQEYKDNNEVTHFLKKENLEIIIYKLKNLMLNRLFSSNEIEIGKDMESKIHNLIIMLDK